MTISEKGDPHTRDRMILAYLAQAERLRQRGKALVINQKGIFLEFYFFWFDYLFLIVCFYPASPKSQQSIYRTTFTHRGDKKHDGSKQKIGVVLTIGNIQII